MAVAGIEPPNSVIRRLIVTNSAYMKVWVDIKLKRCRDSIEYISSICTSQPATPGLNLHNSDFYDNNQFQCSDEQRCMTLKYKPKWDFLEMVLHANDNGSFVRLKSPL